MIVCEGCGNLAKTRPIRFNWQRDFTMQVCTPCVVGILLARPIRILKGIFHGR